MLNLYTLLGILKLFKLVYKVCTFLGCLWNQDMLLCVWKKGHELWMICLFPHMSLHFSSLTADEENSKGILLVNVLLSYMAHHCHKNQMLNKHLAGRFTGWLIPNCTMQEQGKPCSAWSNTFWKFLGLSIYLVLAMHVVHGQLLSTRNRLHNIMSLCILHASLFLCFFPILAFDMKSSPLRGIFTEAKMAEDGILHQNLAESKP